MRPIDGGALWLDLMMLPHNGDIISSEDVERIILEAPTLDYKDLVPQGEWIEDGYLDKPCVCSYCGEEVREYVKFNFCPNCGARMKGGGSDEV